MFFATIYLQLLQGKIMSTRRDFLHRTVVASSALALGGGIFHSTGSEVRADEKRPVKHPVRLGGPVFFSEDDPEKWVQEARKYYRAVYCPNVSLNDKDRIKAFSDAVREHDMVIAEVGRWCNMLVADETERKKNIEKVTEGLALADAIGARCCVNIAGSFHPNHWEGPHPKNLGQEFFDATVENARKIIDTVQPKRAKFALEMMPWSLPDSVDSYLRLLKAIDRKGFGIHVDVCNMINSPKKMYDNTALINDVFDRLGGHIVSCHAKDLQWGPGVQVYFRECPIGEGEIDYGTYLKRIANHPDRDLPLMLEHLKDRAEYELCRERIIKTGRENNVVFEYL